MTAYSLKANSENMDQEDNTMDITSPAIDDLNKDLYLKINTYSHNTIVYPSIFQLIKKITKYVQNIT